MKKFSEWLEAKHPELLEGEGKKVNGKCKPITPYAGSGANQEEKKAPPKSKM